MPVVKRKPTSPGRRFVVSVVNPNLHKGEPYAPLLEKKTRTGGRNNNGRITTRHIGGGHKQHTDLSILSVARTVSRQKSSAWNTIRTVHLISRWFVIPMVSAAILLLRKV